MKRQIHTLTLLLCLSGASCRTPAEPIPVNVPRGFIAVTTEQKQLVSAVHSLSRGMSPADVKTILGKPEGEVSSPTLMTYMLNEDASGGHYVSARLEFDEQGLLKAELGFGHISIEFDMEP